MKSARSDPDKQDGSLSGRAVLDAIAARAGDAAPRLQSVALGAARAEGDWTLHEAVLDALDLDGATVLDIAGDLGELARAAAARGAARIVSIDAEPVRVHLAELATLFGPAPGQAISFLRADRCDLPGLIGEGFDYVFASAGAAAALPLISDIARARPKAFILHEPSLDAQAARQLVSHLAGHFGFILELGRFGRAGEADAAGPGAAIAAFVSEDNLSAFCVGCQARRPRLSSLVSLEVAGCAIAPLANLRRVGGPPAHVLGEPGETTAQSMFRGAAPRLLADHTYWWELQRGHVQWVRDGREITPANPYGRLLGEMTARGAFEDVAFGDRLAADPGLIRAVAGRRLAGFDAAGNPQPVMALAVEAEGGSFDLVLAGGGAAAVTRLDGLHRLGTALLCGVSEHPAYVMALWTGTSAGGPVDLQDFHYGAQTWWIGPRDVSAAAAIIDAGRTLDKDVLNGRSSLVIEDHGRIYRFADGEWTARQFFKEYQVLRELAGRLPADVPAVERLSHHPVHMVQHKLAGSQCNARMFASFGKAQKQRFVRDLARFLGSLHAEDPAGFPLADTRHGEAILSRFGNYRSAFAKLDETGALERFAAETEHMIDRLSSELSGRSLLHGDFVPPNCLVDPQSGALLAVVDFTVAWIGDPHWDFSVIRGAIGRDCFLRLVEAYHSCGGRRINVDLVMALHRTQLCHFLYWISDEQRPALIDQIMAWRPLAG